MGIKFGEKENKEDWKPFQVPHGLEDLKKAEQYILKEYQKAIGERPYNWRKTERLSNELVKVRKRIAELEYR